MAVKTKVVEIERNWILVTFSGPRPDPAERVYWLNRTLRDWLSEHPDRRLHATLPVMQNGALIGVNAWLETPENPFNRELFPKVHRSLGSLHKEYVEALLQHAYQIFFESGGQSDMAAVNRRGIAVVFRGQSQRVEIAPSANLILEDHVKVAMDAWLAAPRSEFFIIDVPAKKSSD